MISGNSVLGAFAELAVNSARRRQWHQSLSLLAHMTESNKSPAPDADSLPATHPRWRKELILTGVCVGFGLIVLPALIYLVGVQLLGAYGGGPHIGSFYGDFFRNLIVGNGRTWFLVVGPYLLLLLLRLIFISWRPKSRVDQPGPNGEAAHAPARKERREPFVAP